jgi:putative membrane protein
LIQRRALDKYHPSGLWTNTCCSHPLPGETNIDAANRRLMEEMGIKIKKRNSIMVNYFGKIRAVMKDFKEVKKFFIIFYLAGITGVIVPFTNPLFLKLIPIALFLSFLALTIFHTNRMDLKTLIVLLSIYLLSFAIEVIGTNTGLIFGAYQYGNSLGFKVFNTPLIIGINWLLLVYMSSSVTEKISINVFSQMIIATSIMLGYDIILEQVAPEIDMWYWRNNLVPLQNYGAWFIIALGFHLIIKAFRIKTQNKLAMVLLICQFVFFLSLLLFFKVIK